MHIKITDFIFTIGWKNYIKFSNFVFVVRGADYQYMSLAKGKEEIVQNNQKMYTLKSCAIPFCFGGVGMGGGRDSCCKDVLLGPLCPNV